MTAPNVRRAQSAAQAKGNARPTGKKRQRSDRQSEICHRLSPSLEEELRDGLRLLQGTRKPEYAGADLGFSRDTFYDRCKEPGDLTVRELMALFVKCPDPELIDRFCFHATALKRFQAVQTKEAGEYYLRVTGKRDPNQGALFEEGR